MSSLPQGASDALPVAKSMTAPGMTSSSPTTKGEASLIRSVSRGFVVHRVTGCAPEASIAVTRAARSSPESTAITVLPYRRTRPRGRVFPSPGASMRHATSTPRAHAAAGCPESCAQPVYPCSRGGSAVGAERPSTYAATTARAIAAAAYAFTFPMPSRAQLPAERAPAPDCAVPVDRRWSGAAGPVPRLPSSAWAEYPGWWPKGAAPDEDGADEADPAADGAGPFPADPARAVYPGCGSNGGAARSLPGP